ncbi:hypothetical protein DPEC_G00347370 [Dallia pectoralis]|uniref:Uncharacterized protein n=1 Tax=Dallia pectoralis TaxID=75939 RepID=A0ACC2F436_DALPE|nr:hypothetical protein DPEC_G00347370 [Dallia pectoralis]
MTQMTSGSKAQQRQDHLCADLPDPLHLCLINPCWMRGQIRLSSQFLNAERTLLNVSVYMPSAAQQNANRF